MARTHLICVMFFKLYFIIGILTPSQQLDEDKGSCKVKTTNGGCCVFPFLYHGRQYNNCTTIDNGITPWCITTNQKWGNCTRGSCKVKTTNGECCVFPFVYNGKLYYNCTTIDYGIIPWCITTNSKWGNCTRDIKGPEERTSKSSQMPVFTPTPTTIPTAMVTAMTIPMATSSTKSMPTPAPTFMDVPKSTDTPREGRQTSQQLENLLQSLSNGDMMPVNASKQLVELTSNSSRFEANDVTLTALALENIVNNTAVLNETGPSIVRTVNNILNIETNVIGESERNNQSSKRILFVIQKYLEHVPIKRGKKVFQNEENLAIQAQDWNVTNFQGVQVTSQAYLTNGKKQSSFIVSENDTTDDQPIISQVSLKMPKTLFETLDSKPEEQRLSFAVFRKTLLFQSPGRSYPYSNKTRQRNVNSFIISASVKGLVINNLTEPVETAYYPLQRGNNKNAECVFWDFRLKNGQGDWSGEDCYYKGTINGLVNCHCNHLTNFAILLDVYIDDRNSDVHDNALSIISYIGCAVSLFGLVLTITTLVVFKDLRRKAPTQILLNFCIALSLTLVVFLAAAEQSKTSSMTVCRAAAVALHYLVLVVFVWMAIQAFNMFMAFVIVLPKHYSHFILKCCIAGWGLPAIIVIITAATSIDSYGDEHFCRVKGLPFLIGLLAPVVVILLANTIAFVAIVRSLLASGSKVTSDRKVTGLQQAKRAIAILSTLGLTWLFGVLAISDARLVFQYLFCIFNSIQGLLVFLLYCVLSAETRAKYKNILFGKSVQSLSGLQDGTPTRSLLPRTSLPQDNEKMQLHVLTTI